MDPRFQPNNRHLEEPARFIELDPQLRRLSQQYYIHHSALLQQLPIHIPGIYTLSGGRQIGKTTLLKQWMLQLLKQNTPPNAIAFFSGELIEDQHGLLRLLQEQLKEMPSDGFNYLIIDEVTYIRDWDKAIKYAADINLFDNVIVILTGSDLALIKEAMMRLPGRRGKASQVNFHLYPLSFRETVQLTRQNTTELEQCLTQKIPDEVAIDMLFAEFYHYLQHGGFLTAINDLASEQKILDSTLMTYSDWIRGDMLRRGKQQHYLQEIIQAIIKRYTSQITWNALAQDLSIDHPKTVADYIAQLELIDAVFVQSALLEDKLVAAPKKSRKVLFTDPFIFHALHAWISPQTDAYHQQILPMLQDPILTAQLVESCAITLYRRYYPTYYLKAEGEVDIAYIDQGRFWPIEIKWTQQLRSKDLKQVLKYPNSRILTKTKQFGQIQNLSTEPLPWALFNLK
ncbi:MAG: ATP-binding protein [Gammaproteobacteria bacterium]